MYVTSEVISLVTMKKQTGIWVDSQVWQAYRELCSRERLQAAEPIEKFIHFILRDGSALSVLNWLDNAGKVEGLEAHARVLLNWYRNGKMRIDTTDEDEAPIEPMLLSTLKDIADPQLREAMEEELLIKPSEEKPSRKQVKTEEEITEKLEKSRKEIKG